MSKAKEFTKLLVTQSERVKCVDLHPKEPLVLCALFNGQVTLWNYETQTLLKPFQILDNPVRCCKFIVRLQSFACGADDMNVRIFNYNTMEKTKTFEAHQDYIRSIAVHEQLPYMLTTSDDMTIKMWDWSANWACKMIFEGHTHYVMQAVFNPKDNATFATASLDHTLMVWSINSPVRNFMLEGHEKGVNCVEYYSAGDKPYLVSGSDDQTVRVWDYQTKQCLQTLTHHSNNVTAVFFHPDLPLLLTAAEDDLFCTVSTQTWRLEQSLQYGLQRGWTIACRGGTNRVAVGFDNGMVVLRIGREEPVMSMDNQGRILVTQGNDVLKMEVRQGLDKDVADGEYITLAAKEIGTTEAPPQRLQFEPSGQNIAVITEGEYSINSALSWRHTKAFGNAIAFAWGNENGTYAVLENGTTLKTFKKFKPKDTKRLPCAADQLFAGPVIGVRVEGGIMFYDWETLNVVRRIDEYPREVAWSDSNELVCLACDTSFVLKYKVADVQEHFINGGTSSEDGLDFAFELAEEIDEKMKQVAWVGDCMVFVTQSDKLNIYIGGEEVTISVLPRGFFFLGFVPKENRLFCIDKERNVISYHLYVSVVEFYTRIVAEDLDGAVAVVPRVPQSMRLRISQFAQSRGYPEIALDITTDDDHRFELALATGKLAIASEVAHKSPSVAKWKQLGDAAIENAEFALAERCLKEAGDFNGLFLIYSSLGDRAGIARIAEATLAQGKSNIAFSCFHMLNQHDRCLDILLATKKAAEAAFYARTYNHARIDECVAKWKAQLGAQPRLRDAIADPSSFPNLFPNVVVAPAPAPEPEPAAIAAPVAAQPASAERSRSASAPQSPIAPAVQATPARHESNDDAGSTQRRPDLTPAMPPAPATTPALKPQAPAPASLDDDDWGVVPAVEAKAVSSAEKAPATGGSPTAAAVDIDDIFENDE